MTEMEKLSNEIEGLRKRLQELIESKDELTHSEILGTSKKLDVLLNEYNEMLKGSS